MKPLTIETVYRNGFIEVPDNVKFTEPMKVLVVFYDEYQPRKYPDHKFSFQRSLELTKNCKGSLSELVIDERRKEKW